MVVNKNVAKSLSILDVTRHATLTTSAQLLERTYRIIVCLEIQFLQVAFSQLVICLLIPCVTSTPNLGIILSRADKIRAASLLSVSPPY